MMYSRTNSPEGALMYKIALNDLQGLVTGRLLWGEAAGDRGIKLPLQDLPRLQHLNLRLVQEALPDQAQSKLTSYLLIALFALALAAVVLFFGLRLAPGLTRDLRELEDFSRRVVEDGFGAQRANIQGSVEVVGLAGSINHMLDRLNEQHSKLQADSEARYRLLVEGTNAISWEASLPDFVYRYVSPQGQTITAIKNEEWLQNGFWQARVHPDDLPAMLEKRAQSVHAKHDYHAEYRFRRQDGSYVWLEEIAAVLFDADGKPASLRGILLDVDERKLAEQRLQEERSKLDRLKNDFVSTVSHELRTPLTSIRGSLGLILGGVAGPQAPQAEKLLRIAHQNSERLVRLINDLLDIDKIVSGKMEFEWQWLDLAGVVEQAIESNQAYANQIGAQIVYLGAEDGPPVQALVKIDINRLLQVLANLLSNAAKFSPKGGNVEVKMEKSVQSVRVSVRDHGNGISPEFRSKIFEKFSQADSSDTRAKGGTGLGLAISKVLIEQMGGQIGFYSEIGKGATFYFDLPL
jgi:PAS domain S-box-containing protein